MKRLRFFCSLIRGPPTNKGVFSGFQPRKDALFLLRGCGRTVIASGCYPEVARRDHRLQPVPLGVWVQIPSSPPLLFVDPFSGVGGNWKTR